MAIWPDLHHDSLPMPYRILRTRPSEHVPGGSLAVTDPGTRAGHHPTGFRPRVMRCRLDQCGGSVDSLRQARVEQGRVARHRDETAAPVARTVATGRHQTGHQRRQRIGSSRLSRSERNWPPARERRRLATRSPDFSATAITTRPAHRRRCRRLRTADRGITRAWLAYQSL